MIFKNLDNKERAYGTIILFGIIAAIFWYMSDGFSTWVASGSPLVVMIVSIVLNPAYLFLIYFLYKDYDFRGIIAGILISVAIDVMSLTHSISNLGILPTSLEANPLYGYSDTTIFKMIYPYIQGPTAAFILYVIIPVALVYLALIIIRRTSSFNKIIRTAA